MKKLYCSLTRRGDIDKLIDTLEEYKASLSHKCVEFVERLLEEGIETARDNSGQYGSNILFHRRIEGDEEICIGVMIAEDKQKIVKTWYRSKRDAENRRNVQSYEISPLLMAEFGSGWLARVLDDVSGVGQGTMPKQRHAFDPDGWAWYDEDGVKHESMGEAPSYPVHAALLSMLFEVDNIAREVFGNG